MLRSSDKKLYLGAELAQVIPKRGVFPTSPVAGYDAWFDAADLDTLTVVSDQLSVWGDKGPDAFDLAQATAGSRPLYGGAGARSINGIVVPEFVPASATFMSSSFPITDTTCTLFGVCLKDGAAGNQIMTVGGGDGARNVDINGTELRFSRMGTAAADSGLFISAGTAFSWAVRYDRVDTANVDFWLNGGRTLNVSYTQTFVGTLAIGRRANGSLYWDGLMAEFLMYDHELTDAEVLQNLQYFAAKWGTAAPLK